MLNDVKLIGRVTKEIEVKKTPQNKSVIRFTLAVDKGKDKKTQFIECQAWEGTAETIAKYVNKGDVFQVSGELNNNNYESNGVKYYSYVVVVNGFTFLPNAKKEQNNNGTFKRSDVDANSEFNQQQTITGDGRDMQGFTLNDDDLPF